MKNDKQIFLPGGGRQLDFLQREFRNKPETILVAGSSSEVPAQLLSDIFKTKIDLIVEDYESLLNSKLLISSNSNINSAMMGFESTDFAGLTFDLIYAQASISLTNRNKIIKEFKRILKPNGFLCAGEITSRKKEIPQFVKDIFDSSNLLPLFVDDVNKYYSERGFNVVAEEDLSGTLHEYYSASSELLKETKFGLSEDEKKYYKKLINKISHESNAFLKLGGEKHIGFKALLLQKG